MNYKTENVHILEFWPDFLSLPLGIQQVVEGIWYTICRPARGGRLTSSVDFENELQILPKLRKQHHLYASVVGLTETSLS